MTVLLCAKKKKNTDAITFTAAKKLQLLCCGQGNELPATPRENCIERDVFSYNEPRHDEFVLGEWHWQRAVPNPFPGK